MDNENAKSLSDDAVALKNFLLDIDCLDPLSRWVRKFNLFDVLDIAKFEIRHSNMLAWLLNPNENHGLDDSVLRGFIQYIVDSYSNDTDTIFNTLLMSCQDFTVSREWNDKQRQRIDILAVSDKEKFVLCIENKIGAPEHGDQLNDYRSIVEIKYPDYRKVYVFLTPEGRQATDPDNWHSMSYTEVLEIIERAKGKVNLPSEQQLLIDNYIDIIRRKIVGDEELKRICRDIYRQHKKALDLIIENLSSSKLNEIIHAWAEEMTAKGEIEEARELRKKHFTRFKTTVMTSIFPDAQEAKSGWETKNHYFYEICNFAGQGGREFFIQFAVSLENIPDHLRAICDRIEKQFSPDYNKYPWHAIYLAPRAEADENSSRETIFEELNKQFEKVREFEKELIEALNNNEPK